LLEDDVVVGMVDKLIVVLIECGSVMIELKVQLVLVDDDLLILHQLMWHQPKHKQNYAKIRLDQTLITIILL
jgi:hypothetical protein